MDEFEEFEGGFGSGCIATIFKMIIAIAFWGIITFGIIDFTHYAYGGFLNSPLGLQYANIVILLIFIWRVGSKPINYFKGRGYEPSETIALGCIGFIIGGGLPLIGVIVLIFAVLFGWDV